MTKQEEILSGVTDFCRVMRVEGMRYNKNFTSEDDAYNILSYLQSQGGVLQVNEICEVTQTASEPETYVASGNGIVLLSSERTFDIYKAFKDAGYVAVGPLIGEGA